jgi:predicted ATPase
MRFSSFSIRNYRGIEFAEATDLDELSTVLMSGRNGTGKSLILEALLMVWSQQFGYGNRVGPWATKCSITISVSLTATELESVTKWMSAMEYPLEDTVVDEDFEILWECDKTQMTVNKPGRIVNVLRNSTFALEHPFAQLTFLPANRLVQLAKSASVDLQLLSSDRREQERQQNAHQYISDRSPLQLGSVMSYLVSVDYQDLLNHRENVGVTSSYSAIVEPLKRATGKVVRVPRSDAARGSIVEVSTPAGHTHEIDMLSSGEQSLIALLYYLYRLGQTGGVVFLDEPEQHLHPALQASLLGEVDKVGEHAQVLVVTHSGPLIASAPERAVFQVEEPRAGQNQIKPALGTERRRELLDLLGLRVSDIVQANFVLVVEGVDDHQRLGTIFAPELGRAKIVVAGGGNQVVQMARSLANSGALLGLPWLALLDRDFRSGDEVAEIEAQRPEIHVWPVREFESLLLDPAILSSTLTKIGSETSVDEAAELLRDAASDLTEDVLENLVSAELARRFPAPGTGVGSRWVRMSANYDSYAEVNRQRAANVQAVCDELRTKLVAEWPTTMLTLADPKIVLKRVHLATGVFASAAALTSALVAHLRDTPAERPAALQDFARRLVQIR